MKVTSTFKPFTIHIESAEEREQLISSLNKGARYMAEFLHNRTVFTEIDTFFKDSIKFSYELVKAIENGN